MEYISKTRCEPLEIRGKTGINFGAFSLQLRYKDLRERPRKVYDSNIIGTCGIFTPFSHREFTGIRAVLLICKSVLFCR